MATRTTPTSVVGKEATRALPGILKCNLVRTLGVLLAMIMDHCRKNHAFTFTPLSLEF